MSFSCLNFHRHCEPSLNNFHDLHIEKKEKYMERINRKKNYDKVARIRNEFLPFVVGDGKTVELTQKKM